MIYAIVVAYNGEAYIGNCVQSLLDSDLVINVIVVDNCSSDRTVEFVPISDRVEIVGLRENIGFGRANNIGLSLALSRRADFVFLLNQDAVVENTCVRELLEAHNRRPEFGILSPLHVNANRDNFDKNFLVAYLARHYSPLFFDAVAGGVRDVYEVPAVNAAAWLVSRVCFEAVGGFDPLFFMYGEDDDYLRRAHMHGFMVGVATKARVIHFRSNEDCERRGSRLNYVKKVGNRYRSEMILYLKSYSGGCFRSTLDMVAVTISRMFAVIVVDRNILGAFALLGASVEILMLLPKIFKHKQESMHVRGVWLDSATD